MNAQKYNGWTNRETWLINLHGFLEAVEDRWIHDMFDSEGYIQAIYLDVRQNILTYREVTCFYEEEFKAAVAASIQADVQHYLDDVAPIANSFLNDLLPDMRPYRHGGVINYMELAEHVMQVIQDYAEHNGWS